MRRPKGMTAVRPAAKDGQDRLSGGEVEVPLWEIVPSPENEQLYGPVLPEDVVGLADDIAKHGQREAIVLTTDNYILSGHRRHAALQLLGKGEARCRYSPVSRDDDDFLAHLIGF